MYPVASPELAPAPAIRRVLLVDDVYINRELLRLFVERQGHIAEQADGGAVAVEQVAAGGIDVVFMDVSMPDVDGLEATRRIRRLAGAVAHTPVWAVTAQTSPEQVAQCLDAGMNGHFSKPVSLEQIRNLLLALQGASEPPQ